MENPYDNLAWLKSIGAQEKRRSERVGRQSNILFIRQWGFKAKTQSFKRAKPAGKKGYEK